MIDRRSKTRRLLEVHIPIALVVAFALLPYLWMILTSLKTPREIARWPVQYLPSVPTMHNYLNLAHQAAFSHSLLDSLIIASGAVALSLAVSFPAAYAFSRFRFRGRGAMMGTFLVVNLLPVVLLIIPLFVIMRQLDLLDTHLGIILGHSTFAIPFSVWMLTSFLKGIPIDLDEACAIDGATRLQTIRMVIMPLAMPGVVTTGVYVFVTSWNEYLFAMMLSGDNVRTVTTALQAFVGEFALDWGLLTAAGTVIAIPVTFFFLMVQKRLVSGLTAGAVKG